MNLLHGAVKNLILDVMIEGGKEKDFLVTTSQTEEKKEKTQ